MRLLRDYVCDTVLLNFPIVWFEYWSLVFTIDFTDLIFSFFVGKNWLPRYQFFTENHNNSWVFKTGILYIFGTNSSTTISLTFAIRGEIKLSRKVPATCRLHVSVLLFFVCFLLRHNFVQGFVVTFDFFLYKPGNSGLRVKQNLLEPECLVSMERNNRAQSGGASVITSATSSRSSTPEKTAPVSGSSRWNFQNITLQSPVGCLRRDPGLINFISIKFYYLR